MLDNPKQFLSSLPNKPGVYQMYDVAQRILYIGKAKSLKKRLTSYFHVVDNPKTKAFMAQVKEIEIIITPNENAALLLESNLIKTKKPRYNILFKDDKSFPYLFLSQHNFPRLSVYRGVINKTQGKYFGPFPDTTAVNFVQNLLQKIFHLRVCKDSFIRNRSRPCMLHQIKLCSAPCVGYVDQAAYALQIQLAEQFLRNKSQDVVRKLTQLMAVAAANLAYEQAANYRDQIVNIRKIQVEQAITKARGNFDVIGLVVKDDIVCINLLFVRHGLVLGNKAYFPKQYSFAPSLGDILEAFVTHYYLQEDVNIVAPDKILLNMKLPQRASIITLLQEKFGRRIMVSDHIQGEQKQLITMTEANGLNTLKTCNCSSAINYSERLADFTETFKLLALPQRIECFDVSHTMGESQVVSCVVFNEQGACKNDYRRFNVKTASIGDDYGALREALLRRYRELKQLPDVIIIDGGVGQLGVASQVLQLLHIHNVLLLAIAKGKTRKPGLEEIYMQGKRSPVVLSPQSQTFYFIQQIRDEAHRFAVSGHRQRMLKSRRHSKLENILGVGKLKRTMLLQHFGGLTELQSAGIDDLMKVKSIGRDLAERIYEYLHAVDQ